MQLDASRAKSVFQKVKRARADLNSERGNRDWSELAIEDFQQVLSRLYGGKYIEKKAVRYEARSLMGLVERYADRIVIYIKMSDDNNDMRFVATKELCHCLIDGKDEHQSTDGVRTIEYLLEEYRISSNVIADEITQSEVLAEAAAIELMYDFDQRKEDREKVQSGSLTHEEISKKHGIPDIVIKRAFESWYHDFAREVWVLCEE